MAIALYGAIVNDTDGFKNKSVNGMIFAASSELLNLGADHSLVVEHIVNYSSLARLRLKSIMLQNMILLNSSKASFFELQEQDLSSTGATIEDAKELMKEAFSLPYVEVSILLDSSQENEIIKIIDKDI
jgi:bifunctional oligoribonuclease and PAP phosphatase NrnA